VFHSRSTTTKKKEKDKDGNKVEVEYVEINIAHFKYLMYELRMKINVIMANDYEWVDERDVELANKI
jgi:hypothetical protein